MTYANGHTMKAVYNSIGQMVAEKWFETEAAAASSTATPIAHYKYVYDGQGNIVRSIDILSQKKYNYEYEEGRIVRATVSDLSRQYADLGKGMTAQEACYSESNKKFYVYNKNQELSSIDTWIKDNSYSPLCLITLT